MLVLKGIFVSLLTVLPVSEGFFKPWRRLFNLNSSKHEKTYPNAIYSSSQGGNNYVHTSPDNYLVSQPHSHYESDDCNCSNGPFRPIQKPSYSGYTPELNGHLQPPPEEYSSLNNPPPSHPHGEYSSLNNPSPSHPHGEYSTLNNPSPSHPHGEYLTLNNPSPIQPPSLYYVGNPEPISSNSFRPMQNTQIQTSNIVPAIQIPNSFQPNVNEMTRLIPGEPSTSYYTQQQSQLSSILTPPHMSYESVSSNSMSNYPTQSVVHFPGPVNQAVPVTSHNMFTGTNIGHPNTYTDFNAVVDTPNPFPTVLSETDKEVVKNLIYGDKYSQNQYGTNAIVPYETNGIFPAIDNPVYVKGSYKKPSLKDYSGEYSQIFDEESPVDITISDTGKVLQSPPSTTMFPEYKIKPAIVDPTSFPTSDSSTELVRDHLLMPTLVKVIETVYRNQNGMQHTL